MEALHEVVKAPQKKPQSDLTKSSFCKVYSTHVATLPVMKSDSDFCNTCTKIENYASSTVDLNAEQAFLTSRNEHREEAALEFRHNKFIQCSLNIDHFTLHWVFDFAEKFLPPNI